MHFASATLVHPPCSPPCSADQEEVHPTPNLQPKRLSVSARKTKHLQEKALFSMLARVRQGEIEDPQIYGYEWQYVYNCCYGALDREKHYGHLGTVVRPINREDTAVYLTEILHVKEAATETAVVPIADFKIQEVYPRRTPDDKLSPHPNHLAITSSKNAI